MSARATWMLIDRASRRVVARAAFGRLSALLDDAVVMGRAQCDPETGRIRLLANGFITLRGGQHG